MKTYREILADNDQIPESSDDRYLDVYENGLNKDAIRELHQDLFSHIANAITSRCGETDKRRPNAFRPVSTSSRRRRRRS